MGCVYRSDPCRISSKSDTGHISDNPMKQHMLSRKIYRNSRWNNVVYRNNMDIKQILIGWEWKKLYRIFFLLLKAPYPKTVPVPWVTLSKLYNGGLLYYNQSHAFNCVLDFRIASWHLEPANRRFSSGISTIQPHLSRWAPSLRWFF